KVARRFTAAPEALSGPPERRRLTLCNPLRPTSRDPRGRLRVREEKLVVLDEELVAIAVGELLEVLAELAERVLAAFEVLVVGAEAVDFLEPVALDHQRQVLVPERRDADVAPHVLAGLHVVLDADLVHEVAPQVHALDAGTDPGRAAFGDPEAKLR